MHEFRSVHKMFKKTIAKGKTVEQDIALINEKLMKMSKLKRKMKTLYKITPCCHSKQNLWLLKPTSFNRGIGIHIFQSFEELCEIMHQSYGIGKGRHD